jgi:flagellar operon protein (TIGR03826 family)
MSWKNCSRCGKAYNWIPGNRELCTACIKLEEDNFKKVFDFLTSNPAATAQKISQGTGVELKDIYRFVRENRLRLVKTDALLRCESCGVPISKGKLCDKCMKNLEDEIKKEQDKYRKNHNIPSNSDRNYRIRRNNQTGSIERERRKNK